MYCIIHKLFIKDFFCIWNICNLVTWNLLMRTIFTSKTSYLRQSIDKLQNVVFSLKNLVNKFILHGKANFFRDKFVAYFRKVHYKHKLFRDKNKLFTFFLIHIKIYLNGSFNYFLQQLEQKSWIVWRILLKTWILLNELPLICFYIKI